jgi:peptidylprolyl isomerase
MRKVKEGDFVQVHYTGTLEDGSVFDSSQGRQPLEFQAGGQGIIAGFNNAVMDMAVDEVKEVTLPPEEAYGQPSAEAQREFPCDMLGEMKIAVGQDLMFSTPRGPVSGKVLEVGPDTFLVDFNHPLAGKTLKFEIRVVGISDHPTQVGCGCGATGCDPGDCGPNCG